MRPEVAAAALRAESGTLHLFARFYGRMCRAWMLITLCRGGLYITGGIAARNPLTVTAPAFMAEIHADARFSDLLRTIPVYLVRRDDSGLWRAARRAGELARQ